MSLEGKIRFRSSALLHVKWNSNPEWKFKERRKRSLEDRVSSRLKFLKFLFAKKSASNLYSVHRGVRIFSKVWAWGAKFGFKRKGRGFIHIVYNCLNAWIFRGSHQSPKVGVVGKILYSGWTTSAPCWCKNRMSLIQCAYWGPKDVVSWKAVWPRCL